jgi:hypothetical protein
MSASVPRRRELVAYSAGLFVLAGLMAVVILSGSVITAKKPASDLVPAQITALQQR